MPSQAHQDRANAHGWPMASIHPHARARTLTFSFELLKICVNLASDDHVLSSAVWVGGCVRLSVCACSSVSYWGANSCLGAICVTVAGKQYISGTASKIGSTNFVIFCTQRVLVGAQRQCCRQFAHHRTAALSTHCAPFSQRMPGDPMPQRLLRARICLRGPAHVSDLCCVCFRQFACARALKSVDNAAHVHGN